MHKYNWATGTTPVNPRSIVDDLTAQMSALANGGDTLLSYKWSHALALSAGRHVESLAGCNVYPEYIID